MKKILFVLPILLLSLFNFSCQSGKATRIDSSQVAEYRDLTIRDLDEFSAKMFPKLMQSPIARKIEGRLPVIAIGPMSAQTTVEFPESIRINGLKNIITQSGLARISGTTSNSSLNDFINFANSQRGRSGTNLPDFVLTQEIFESREYQRRVINKTYRYQLQLVDLNPNSPNLGQVVVSESEDIIKMVNK
ncbi:MAG: hypothetical protein VW576_08330 [Opitutae bacterium]